MAATRRSGVPGCARGGTRYRGCVAQRNLTAAKLLPARVGPLMIKMIMIMIVIMIVIVIMIIY